MANYYNEHEPFAAQWLRNLMAAGHIADGDVDERSIEEVAPDDLVWYDQCHFFAGIGGWALAARLAGWPDDRELWTGSPPCQPFSVAGQQRGADDERHLWPDYFRLVRARRPAVVVGEQVAAAIGKNWLDGVLADLESDDYACRALVLPACAVDGPHRRDRILFLADRNGAMDHGVGARLEGLAGHGDEARRRAQQDRSVAEAGSSGALDDAYGAPASGEVQAGRVLHPLANPSPWATGHWIIGHDGKARRVQPEIRLLVDGVSARVGRLRAYGNAIVPQLAAQALAAYMECRP